MNKYSSRRLSKLLDKRRRLARELDQMYEKGDATSLMKLEDKYSEVSLSIERLVQR